MIFSARATRWLGPVATMTVLTIAVVLPHPASAQDTAPRVTYQNIEDGDTIGEPPFVIQMCFAEQIDIRDLHQGGDFNFSLFSDQGVGAGLRIVFQLDGLGVAVYPGEVGTPLPGQVTPTGDPGWLFTYRVRDADTEATTEGEINFAVEEDAEPVPEATPPSCLGGESTPGPGTPLFTPIPTETGEANGTDDAESPDATEAGETGDGEEEDEEGIDEEDDDDPDILLLALLTIGGAAALAVLGLIAYLIRRRVGHDPHAPTPGDSDTGDHH
jgi:hypothetical protein